MGLIDGSPYDAIPASQINAPAHRALALKSAEEAIVLLSNPKGALPLHGSPKIAVIGPNAELLQSIEGNYTGVPKEPSFPLDALKKTFGADHITYAPGAPLMDGMRMPIPSVYLKPSADSTEEGLKAEYFDNTSFDGAPKVTRIDRVINFDWYHTAPDGFKPMGFAVRWTGVIVPPKTGSYQIGFRMVAPRPGQPAPNIKVWVDGKLVITPDIALSDAAIPKCNSGMCAQPGYPVEVDFADTRPHAVRIDYVRATEDRASSLDWIAPDEPLVAGAVEAAQKSDVVIAFVGLSPDLEGEEMAVDYPGFSGGDRTSLNLPAAQQKMLEAVKATGKPLVVVYMTGGEVSDPWVEQNADAVVQAWYPGVEGGDAIANVLSGKTNPSGRLPYTIYRDIADLPAFEDYNMKGRTYRYFTGTPVYPFGFGLSYSAFEYSALGTEPLQGQAANGVRVRTVVRNTGTRAADEVAELYLDPPDFDGAPRLALRGFRRLTLEPGESREVVFDLSPRDLSFVTRDGERQIFAGTYRVTVGSGQPQSGTPFQEAKFDMARVVPIPE